MRYKIVSRVSRSGEISRKMAGVSDRPDPAPSTAMRLANSANTSDTTQVPTAKYAPRRRNTANETGIDIRPANGPASNSARYTFMFQTPVK